MEFSSLKTSKLEMGMFNVSLYLNYTKIKVFNFVDNKKLIYNVLTQNKFNFDFRELAITVRSKVLRTSGTITVPHDVMEKAKSLLG